MKVLNIVSIQKLRLLSPGADVDVQARGNAGAFTGVVRGIAAVPSGYLGDNDVEITVADARGEHRFSGRWVGSEAGVKTTLRSGSGVTIKRAKVEGEISLADMKRLSWLQPGARFEITTPSGEVRLREAARVVTAKGGIEIRSTVVGSGQPAVAGPSRFVRVGTLLRDQHGFTYGRQSGRTFEHVTAPSLGTIGQFLMPIGKARRNLFAAVRSWEVVDAVTLQPDLLDGVLAKIRARLTQHVPAFVALAGEPARQSPRGSEIARGARNKPSVAAFLAALGGNAEALTPQQEVLFWLLYGSWEAESAGYDPAMGSTGSFGAAYAADVLAQGSSDPNVGRTWQVVSRSDPSGFATAQIVGKHTTGGYLVQQSDENKRLAAIVKPADLESEIAFAARNVESEARRRDAEKERQAQAQKAAAAHNALPHVKAQDTWLQDSGKSAMQHAKAKDVLQKQIGYNGQIMSQGELAYKKTIDDGWRVMIVRAGNPKSTALAKEVTVLMAQDQSRAYIVLPKTVLDFAQWLGDRADR